jgi:hypothetical protein
MTSITSASNNIAYFEGEAAGTFNGREVVIAITIKKVVGRNGYRIDINSIRVITPEGVDVVVNYKENGRTLDLGSEPYAVISIIDPEIKHTIGFTIKVVNVEKFRGKWTVIIPIIDGKSDADIQLLTLEAEI